MTDHTRTKKKERQKEELICRKSIINSINMQKLVNPDLIVRLRPLLTTLQAPVGFVHNT